MARGPTMLININVILLIYYYYYNIVITYKYYLSRLFKVIPRVYLSRKAETFLTLTDNSVSSRECIKPALLLSLLFLLIDRIVVADFCRGRAITDCQNSGVAVTRSCRSCLISFIKPPRRRRFVNLFTM